MNKTEKDLVTVAVVSTVVSLVLARIVIKIADRKHAKRMKEPQNLGDRVYEVNHRMMAIANAIDAELDTAKFWEIVTRP